MSAVPDNCGSGRPIRSVDSTLLELFRGELRSAVRDEVRAALDSREPVPQGWMDVARAAEYLSMPEGALRSTYQRGQIPFHRTATGGIRFRRDELDAFATAGDQI